MPELPPTPPECRVLGPGDEAVLADVAADVFDGPVRPQLVAEFLADPRHHLVVAVEAGRVVGFVSAVHYVHPDKPAELWINEVGVAPAYRQQGLGRRLLDRTLALGRELGCANAWMLADSDNVAAMRLYRASGGVAAAEPAVMFEFDLS
jgi:aminoglycoside 6'-N-acetyltransferase I